MRGIFGLSAIKPPQKKATNNICVIINTKEEIMAIATQEKRVSDMTVSELRAIIRDTVMEATDPEAIRETMEILADSKLRAQIKASRKAFKSGKKDRFISLSDLKK